MSLKVGNLELFMGPKQAGGPDDLEKVIVDFISKATRRLDIAVQELDSRPIADAIIAARQRKVTVRLVLEGDYLSSTRRRSDPYVAGGPHEPNREIHAAMLRTAINVKSDYNPHIFHQKFIVRDNETVLTGSTNFTQTGVSSNLNNVVIIQDTDIAKIYGREFREIMQGHFGNLNEGHDAKPPEKTVSGIPLKVLFAPDHAPEMEIMKQMLKAKNRIDFAVFTFAESSGIDDAMLSVAAGGIKIRGALDGLSSNSKWAATHGLAGKANIELFNVRKQTTVNKLHHKLMVIDERVVIVGSFNYTGQANRLNDENIIVLGDLRDDVSQTSKNNQEKVGKFALDEIDRIVQQFGSAII
ncbi:MAG: hypothetical protein BZY79_03120 [SAR202 cluster bacterium Casp-Chloro-G4]|nr:phospholipase D-like domain-containing protein [Chloroflexota bacterium]MDA1227757.1 phospholipase D-like domain-containing protein [Chloroflexota bacterium]PKB61558.1 MAG: hypothetical protein BZY79_03120 [SAR202 cluster bacterium Casp-Chloro-G4]